MPIYEYECEACGKRTELLQRVGAPAIGTCPECKGEMRRLVSAPAFQFKGSGWYVTDYAKKGRTSGSDSQPEGSEGPEGDGKSKSESESGDSSNSAGESGSKKKDSASKAADS